MPGYHTLLGISLLLVRSVALAEAHEGLSLLARQSGTSIDPSLFPTACQATCTSALSTVTSGCTSASCVCTDEVSRALAECLDCAVASNGLTIEEAEATLEGFDDACDGGIEAPEPNDDSDNPNNNDGSSSGNDDSQGPSEESSSASSERSCVLTIAMTTILAITLAVANLS